MELASVFTDNIVFSAHKPIRIFGSGKGTVTAEICGNRVESNCESDKWVLELPAMNYGGPYELNINLNGKTTVIKNVLIGKVYIAAGQSNIEFKLRESDYPKESYETEDSVRFVTVDPFREEINPTGWVTCDSSSDDLMEISALAYHFSLELFKKQHIPIGVICCHRGASIIESWLSEEDVCNPEFDLDIKEKHIDHYFEGCSAWNKPAYLYKNAFSTFVPYAVDGVIWYQGESDTTVAEAEIYGKELEALINRWREDLRDKNLSFYIVQIADFDGRKDEGWYSLQKAQEDSCKTIKNTHLIISKDICSSKVIHPPEKEKLGLRIADAILG